jgi:hypothetical protein
MSDTMARMTSLILRSRLPSDPIGRRSASLMSWWPEAEGVPASRLKQQAIEPVEPKGWGLSQGLGIVRDYLDSQVGLV